MCPLAKGSKHRCEGDKETTMNRLTKLMLILSPAVLIWGCTHYTTPVGPVARMTNEQKNFEAVWQASRQVLRKYLFEIDSEDRRAGLIVTKPVTGKHLGEFWRKDAAENRDLAESTIQTVFRQAQVSIMPVAPGSAEFRANVEVRTLRSNSEQIQISGVSDAYDLFNRPGASNSHKRLRVRGSKIQDDVPVSVLGRDAGLESLMAQDIAAVVPAVRASL